MRIHPVQIRTASNGWQIPVILVLLAVLFISNLVSDENASDMLRLSADTDTRDVVVATRALYANEVVDENAVRLEARPVSTLPQDVITDLSEVVGFHTLGPIPARYPFSKMLLSTKQQKSKEQFYKKFTTPQPGQEREAALKPPSTSESTCSETTACNVRMVF